MAKRPITAAVLHRRQIKKLREHRDLALETARFVRDNGLDGDVAALVETAWLDHRALLSMQRGA